MKKIICFLILVGVLFSCKKDTPKNKKSNHSNNEYYDDNLIYDDNNFKDKTKTLTLENGKEIITNKKTHKIGDIYYTATILPIEYYIRKNLKLQNSDSIKYYKNKLKGEKVVQFEFQQKDRKDLLSRDFTSTDYETAVKYMAFTIKNDFYAITAKGDTIKSKGVLFERNFKLAPFKRILVYFKDDEEINELQLIYNDNLFENGILKFNLKTQ